VHPLLAIFRDAAIGRFPEMDGGVTFLPELGEGQEAVVCFTGHAFIASRLTADDLSDLAPDGLGRALHPEVLLRMAGPRGSIGSIDITMFADGLGGGALVPRPELDQHPRVAFARARREQVRAYGSPDGLFTLGLGLGGRREMSVENSPDGPRGRHLIHQALTMTPHGEHLFAAVAPGNARSVRSFLACGFIPIASEVLVSVESLGKEEEGQVRVSPRSSAVLGGSPS
jgi:hypothetical protein